MQITIKKFVNVMSVFGISALLVGCSTCDNMEKQKMHNRPQHHMQNNEKTNRHQMYDNTDIHNRMGAKMFTRNGKGEKSKMGHIMFNETDNGVKMDVDLTDLRPNVPYTVHVYPCVACDEGMCCGDKNIASDMPKLHIKKRGRLSESFMIHGVEAKQLKNSKICLERDGGVKAAWGQIDSDM